MIIKISPNFVHTLSQKKEKNLVPPAPKKIMPILNISKSYSSKSQHIFRK